MKATPTSRNGRPLTPLLAACVFSLVTISTTPMAETHTPGPAAPSNLAVDSAATSSATSGSDLPTLTVGPSAAATPTPTPSPTPPPDPATAPPASTPATTVSPLQVQGNQLVDATGHLLVLHGVNRSGTEYMCLGSAIFDGPNDAASVAAIKSWRTNAVRIPMNEDCWLGINGISPNLSGAPYQQAIKDYVNLLNENGLYAILDLHWTAPATTKATGQMPMPDLDHAPTFWSQVASAFKGNDAVIFEPFNEPYPGVMQDSADSWTCWRDGGTCKGIAYETAGMQTLVDAIRATGATNAIALGGLQWSNLLSQWLAYKPNDPQNKIVAAWHMYSFQPCDTPACFGDTVGAVAAQVPLIATEIGTDTCDATFMNALMSWLDAHQTGYLAWRWDARPDDCTRIALITDYTGSPSTYGQVYKTHLADLP